LGIFNIIANRFFPLFYFYKGRIILVQACLLRCGLTLCLLMFGAAGEGVLAFIKYDYCLLFM